MANEGFSAPVNYWGTITGLTPSSSEDGRNSQLAEASDEYGDTVAHVVYADTIAPKTDYVVSGTIENSNTLVTLGSIHTTTDSKKIMLTQVVITTNAGTPPTVSISGVEVESGATAKRTYDVAIALTARSKAQDVAGALTASNKFTSITTTFSVDPHVATVNGLPVASDASHGKVEVQVTMTDHDGQGDITAASGGGFTVTTVPATSNPDAGYITRTATASKFLTGTEPS